MAIDQGGHPQGGDEADCETPTERQSGSEATRSRLETDEDVTPLLQQRYQSVDDPAARAAIVARFTVQSERSVAIEQRWTTPRRLALVAALLVGVLISMIGRAWLKKRSDKRGGDKVRRSY